MNQDAWQKLNNINPLAKLAKNKYRQHRHGRHSVLTDRKAIIRTILKTQAEETLVNELPTPKNRLPKLTTRVNTQQPAQSLETIKHKLSEPRTERRNLNLITPPLPLQKKSLNPKQLFTHRRKQPPQSQSLESPKFNSSPVRKSPFKIKNPQFVLLSMGLNELVQSHRKNKLIKSMQQEEDQPTRQKSGTIQYQEIKTYYEEKYMSKKA